MCACAPRHTAARASAALAGAAVTALAAWLSRPDPPTDQASAPMPFAVPGLDFASASDGLHFVLRQADGPPGPAVKVILNWPTLLEPQ